jgi:multiple antibiotic resistance protein
MIIAYMGFDMLSGRHTVAQAPPSEGDVDVGGGSLAPLIMLAAGPGTITAFVTLAAVHTSDSLPPAAIAAAVIGTGVTFAVLLLAIQLGSHLGKSTQVIVTRFMGLIVASMGIQFVPVGLKASSTLSAGRSARPHPQDEVRLRDLAAAASASAVEG